MAGNKLGPATKQIAVFQLLALFSSVYCVQTGEEITTEQSSSGGHVRAPAACLPPLTSSGRVRTQGSPCVVCGGESGIGQIFLPISFTSRK